MTVDSYQILTIHSDRLQACGISHPGRRRSANQDSILLDARGSFVLLADGMGGHERGDEASSTAVEIIRQYLGPDAMAAAMLTIVGGDLPPEVACMLSLMDTAVREANAELYNRNQREGVQLFMGTTIVVLAVVSGGFVVWCHVGDSRIYRWRDDRLTCLTADHSVYAAWERGGKIGIEPHKNIITRAIGPGRTVKADSAWAPVHERDLYLLCSDGLSDMLVDDEIGLILKGEQDLEGIARRLVDAANAAGGRDNISAVVCSV